MKVLFLIQGFDHPASRYRVLQYLDVLRASGVEDKVVRYPENRSRWRALAGDLAECDIVFVQKKRLKPRRVRFIRRCGPARIVYDVDDAVMFKSSRAKSRHSRKRMSAFGRMCKASNFVIAGNSYLEQMAREHNANTAIVPTSINTDLYPERKARETDDITLGWIGGRKSLVFLKELAPVLEEVHGRHPKSRLKIVCNKFFDLSRMPVVRKEWSETEEGADVASFDVGLAPLPDDPWSRGKCATKLLQCMAAGVPCVASAVGVHKEIIKEGENGFLAGTPEEWREALSRLCSDAGLRSDLGRKARATVERDYSLESSAPKLLEILRKITGTGEEEREIRQ